MNELKLIFNKGRYILKKDNLERDKVLQVSGILNLYFRNGEKDNSITQVLTYLKDDDYYDIIADYYKDNLTVEQIAENRDQDRATISRNKKRLLIIIYYLLEVGKGAESV